MHENNILLRLRSEYLRPSSFPVTFVDLIRLLRVKGRGDKRQAKLLVLLLRVKNSMFRFARAEQKRKGTFITIRVVSGWWWSVVVWLSRVVDPGSVGGITVVRSHGLLLLFWCGSWCGDEQQQKLTA